MTLEHVVQPWDGNTTGADPGHRVLVLPGARYSSRRPGLAWPLRALALQGWQVWCAAWEIPRTQPREQCRATVDRAISSFLEQAGRNPELVLAKSVGTLAAGWVADHHVPTVWTTPLLDDKECVEDITRAGSPALLLAGSRDHTWDDDAARRTGKQVELVPGADHGWETGDWRTELDAVRRVAGAVEDFAARRWVRAAD
jgi:hypothetical protein